MILCLQPNEPYMADQTHLSKENQQLQIAINELKVLNDIATTISSLQSVDEIIEQIVIKCIKHLHVDEGTISLLEKKEATEEFHTFIRHKGSGADTIPFKLDNRLKGWMLAHRKVLLSNDIKNDDQFEYFKHDNFIFRSILCVPLLVKGELIGYLAVFNKHNGAPFTNQDKRLLSIIGSQSAQLIENARLYEEEKALLLLQEEVKMASSIQRKLLPESKPEIPGFQVSCINIPAQSVGGDYYDFIHFSSGKIGFCVGDITGKGMPAAMLMANLQATIRSQASIFEESSDCLRGTNKLLFHSTDPEKFATVFYGILEPESGTMEFANGGHDAPLLLKKGKEIKSLHATGLLLGMMENASYNKGNITLDPGDTLLIYTDGVTEAMDTANNEYGLQRLHQHIADHNDKSSDELMNFIISDIRKHAEGTSQSDDITLMIIKRT